MRGIRLVTVWPKLYNYVVDSINSVTVFRFLSLRVRYNTSSAYFAGYFVSYLALTIRRLVSNFYCGTKPWNKRLSFSLYCWTEPQQCKVISVRQWVEALVRLGGASMWVFATCLTILLLALLRSSYPLRIEPTYVSIIASLNYCLLKQLGSLRFFHCGLTTLSNVCRSNCACLLSKLVFAGTIGSVLQHFVPYEVTTKEHHLSSPGTWS